MLLSHELSHVLGVDQSPEATERYNDAKASEPLQSLSIPSPQISATPGLIKALLSLQSVPTVYEYAAGSSHALVGIVEYEPSPSASA
jgi:hypothetical protein